MLMTCQQTVKEGSVSDPTMHFSISSDESLQHGRLHLLLLGSPREDQHPMNSSFLILQMCSTQLTKPQQVSCAMLYPCGLLSPEPISLPLTQKTGRRKSMWSPQLPVKFPSKVKPIAAYIPWIMALSCGGWGGSARGGTFKGHQGGLVCRDSIDQSQCPEVPMFHPHLGQSREQNL